MDLVPELIRVKRRKFSEVEPPDVLCWDPKSSKRMFTEICYQRVKDKEAEFLPILITGPSSAVHKDRDEDPTNESGTPKQEDKAQAAQAAQAPRIFRMSRSRAQHGRSLAKVKKSRNRKIATFVEASERAQSSAKAKRSRLREAAVAEMNRTGDILASSPPRKRPGAGSRAPKPSAESSETASAQSDGPRAHFGDQPQAAEALAQKLHEFALDDIARQPKPILTHKPKRCVARFHERHPEVASASPLDVAEDVEMDDESDYVYETYVRSIVPVEFDAGHIGNGKVGFIVITEEDEEHWQTFLESDDFDKDWNSEEEDENAEDWYGADYPEDEIASDDERDQGAYGYRYAGSDDEQWDNDTGTFSDDEDRTTNPWKKGPWVKSKVSDDENDDENDEDYFNA